MARQPEYFSRQSEIKEFVYRGGWDVRWDEQIPGLGVRIMPSGKMSFVLSYRNHEGRKRLMVLGRVGADLTLTQARDKARKERVCVREGGDPLNVKQKATQGETLKDLIDAFIERHGKPHKKTWKADQRRLNRLVPASWMGRKITGISRKDISDLHHKIGAKTPYEANRLLENIKTMFNLAPVWGFAEEGHPNPTAKIAKFKEQKRKRWLKPEELPALAKAVDAEPSIYVRSAIWLYLLTGIRRMELLQAKWEDVDWDRGTLRLPETKSGDEQTATLNAPSLAILQATPKMEGNPHILPGAIEGRHLVNIAKPWERIRTAAGMSDLRLHDLRRSVGSWLTQDGTDLNLIKEALRHSDLSTTLTYARLGADAARDAMESHGKRILEAAGKHRPIQMVGVKSIE
jgi:integrase